MQQEISLNFFFSQIDLKGLLKVLSLISNSRSMPLVKVEYDESKVGKDTMIKLCEALREIIIETTNISEVYVYANSSQIRVQVNPIEVFIEMSAHKVVDIDGLMKHSKSLLKERKLQNNFIIPITLTIIPMHWKFEVDI